VALSDASGNIERNAHPRIRRRLQWHATEKTIQLLVEARQHIGDHRCVEFRRDMKAAREMRGLFAANGLEGGTAL